MLKIALTGGIGSGKTSVSNQFKKLGIPVIDTDVIAHDLVNYNATILEELSGTFGNKILDKNGGLNRQKLATIIFNDADKKRQLEEILHPKIRDNVKRQLQELQDNSKLSPSPPSYCILVIPLLFETGHTETAYGKLIDRILLVISEQQTRIKRITERDNRSIDEINLIIKAQVNDETRIAKADDILNNNSDIKTLQSRVLDLHNKYSTIANSAR